MPERRRRLVDEVKAAWKASVCKARAVLRLIDDERSQQHRTVTGIHPLQFM